MRAHRALNLLFGIIVSILCFTLQPAAVLAGVSALSDAVRTADNMEPAVPQPQQEAAVAKKNWLLSRPGPANDPTSSGWW